MSGCGVLMSWRRFCVLVQMRGWTAGQFSCSSSHGSLQQSQTLTWGLPCAKAILSPSLQAASENVGICVCFLKNSRLSGYLWRNGCERILVLGEALKHFLFCCLKNFSVLSWNCSMHFTPEHFKGNRRQSLHQESENYFLEVISKEAKRSLAALEPEHWRSQVGSCGHFMSHVLPTSYPQCSEEPRKEWEGGPRRINHSDYVGLLNSSVTECHGELISVVCWYPWMNGTCSRLFPSTSNLQEV